MSNPVLSKIISPTVLLYTFVTISQFGRGLYLASADGGPPGFMFINAVGFLWILGWWLLKDSRKRGVAWVYDLGLFLYVAWPFIMPYYLLKSRGTKGLFVIVAFAVVYVSALLAGTILYVLLNSGAG
ncbi:MAG TPA: hypothetical protein VGJ66_14230 [Pyrinomonadaceae bacterium]|jgi:hypothetical protein